MKDIEKWFFERGADDELVEFITSEWSGTTLDEMYDWHSTDYTGNGKEVFDFMWQHAFSPLELVNLSVRFICETPVGDDRVALDLIKNLWVLSVLWLVRRVADGGAIDKKDDKIRVQWNKLGFADTPAEKSAEWAVRNAYYGLTWNCAHSCTDAAEWIGGHKARLSAIKAQHAMILELGNPWRTE